MANLQILLSVIAVTISCGALAISFFAYRQSKLMASLSMRRETINHVRAAISDVVLHGSIRTETVNDIRDAFQLSSLVFSSNVPKALDEAHIIAFRLVHKSMDRQTDQDLKDKARLVDQLNDVLKVMVAETTLGKQARMAEPAKYDVAISLARSNTLRIYGISAVLQG